MGKIADSLKRYFAETTKDILNNDWEQLKVFSEIGPDALDYIKRINDFQDSIKPIDARKYQSEFEPFQTECKLFMAA